MVNLCPGCARSVADADEVCPHCQRDFRLPSRPARQAPTAPKSSPIERIEIDSLPDNDPAPIADDRPASRPPYAGLAAAAAVALALHLRAPASAPGARTPASPAEAVGPLRDSPAPLPSRLASVFFSAEAPAAPARAPRRLIRSSSPRGRAHFFGTVLDIHSLEPVAGARLEFIDLSSGRKIGAITDWTGAYDLDLPPNSDGYALSIRRDGYGPGFAEADSEAVQATSADARRRMAEEISAGAQTRDPFTAVSGERTRYDFSLAALRG